MKIVALDYHTLNPGDIDDSALRALGQVETFYNSDLEQAIARAQDAEVIIVNKFKVDDTILKHLPKLKYLCVSATGYNNIDINAAKTHSVKVSNVKGYSTASVVQQVFSLIFSITNEVARYSNEVSNNEWSDQDHFSYWHEPIRELNGKTLGLLGYGDIAKGVAKVALAFGMNVKVNHLSKLKSYPNGVVWDSWVNILSSSDIISLHAPLTDATSNIINKDSLAQMKKEAILINTARGPLVDEQVLYDALRNKTIRAAGLDVLCAEPPAKNHPLFDLDNCIITPHQAWASLESRQRLLQGLINNINGYKEGDLLNVVSY